MRLRSRESSWTVALRGLVVVVSEEAGTGVRAPLTGRSVPQVASVSAAEIEQLLAWQPRLLDFTAAPLRTVVAEFNRRNAPTERFVGQRALYNLVHR